MNDKEVKIPNEGLEALYLIEGISVEEGLKYCGNKKALDKFLYNFYSAIDIRSSEIEDAYKSGDGDYYKIKVHALKSSARIIGASELSELAWQLEQAAEAQDKPFIDANTDSLLKMYRDYKERLADHVESFLRASDDRTVISDDDLSDACSALRELVSVMDYDGVEMILSELDVYRLPEDITGTLNKIKGLLPNFKWDEIQKIVDKELTKY
jgi:HPt (histidine-containing phosphotransfer) domain-containing protein